MTSAPDAARRRPRGSYTKGRAKRAEILRRAVVVFAESGYRGGSLKDIADGVGLTQAGLLHHFASKEHLLAEVLAERDAEDTARLWGEDAPTGWAAVDALTALVRHNVTVPGLVQLFATLSGEAVAEDHPAHDFFVERYRRTRGQVEAALITARDAGEVPADLDIPTAAAGVVALMDGLQIQWLLEPETIDMPAIVEAFLSRLRSTS